MGYRHSIDRVTSIGVDPNQPITEPFGHRQSIPAAPHQVLKYLKRYVPFLN